jgi:hypothetical protein
VTAEVEVSPAALSAVVDRLDAVAAGTPWHPAPRSQQDLDVAGADDDIDHRCAGDL